jgi:hypothetical protein
MMTKLDPKDPESLSNFLRNNVPDAPNDHIRKAIGFCWWMLPKDQRTEENVECEIRRLVEEALADLRDHKGSFDMPFTV